MSRRNGSMGKRLIEPFNALQRRETTFAQIYAMSVSRGIDARRVLADHFREVRTQQSWPRLPWAGKEPHLLGAHMKDIRR